MFTCKEGEAGAPHLLPTPLFKGLVYTLSQRRCDPNFGLVVSRGKTDLHSVAQRCACQSLARWSVLQGKTYNGMANVRRKPPPGGNLLNTVAVRPTFGTGLSLTLSHGKTCKDWEGALEYSDFQRNLNQNLNTSNFWGCK